MNEGQLLMEESSYTSQRWTSRRYSEVTKGVKYNGHYSPLGISSLRRVHIDECLSKDEYLHNMEEGINITIDPACLQEPPLAVDVIKGMWPTLLLSTTLLIMSPYQSSFLFVWLCHVMLISSVLLLVRVKETKWMCWIWIHLDFIVSSVQVILSLSSPTELDVFGMCLYAMLTLMSCISLLLYLEQCVYIYTKLPYPKKTTIMWINGAAPVSIWPVHSGFQSY